MNPFLVIQAALCLGASCYEMARGNTVLALVYLAWSVSNGAMSFIGAKP